MLQNGFDLTMAIMISRPIIKARSPIHNLRIPGGFGERFGNGDVNMAFPEGRMDLRTGIPLFSVTKKGR